MIGFQRQGVVKPRESAVDMPYVNTTRRTFTHRVFRLSDGSPMWRANIADGYEFDETCRGVAIGADSTFWATFPRRRYSSSGKLLQTDLYGDDSATATILRSDAAGNLYQIQGGVGSEVLKKWDPDGSLLWSTAISSGIAVAVPYGHLVDDAGNSYVVVDVPLGYQVEKYDAGGALAWASPVRLGLAMIAVDRETGFVSLDKDLYDSGGSLVHDFGESGGGEPFAALAMGGGNAWVLNPVVGQIDVYDLSDFSLVASRAGNITATLNIDMNVGLPDGSAVFCSQIEASAEIFRLASDGSVIWWRDLGFLDNTPRNIWAIDARGEHVIVGGDACNSLREVGEIDH